MEKVILKEWVEKKSGLVVEPSSPAIADQLLRPLPDGFPPPKLDHYMYLLPSRVLVHLEKGSNYPDAGEIYQHLPMDDETKAFLRKRRNVAEIDLDDCAALLRLGDALNDPKCKDSVILLVIKKCLTSTALYGPLSATDVENWNAVECKTLRAQGLSYKIYSALLFDINIGDTVRLHPNIRDGRDCMEGAEEYEQPVQYGILRYQAPIFKLESTAFWANNSDREKDDTWLGVELRGKFAGRGDSDGTVNGKRYFSCRDKSARFVAFWDVDYSLPEPETWCRCKLVDPLDKIVSKLIKERSIANPKNPWTIQEVENALNRAFPHPLFCTVELVAVQVDLITEYGGKKHQQELEKLRKLAGVFDVMCSEHESAKYFVVTADSKMYRAGRDSLEVAREVFKHPSPLARDAFSKPNCESLKTVRSIGVRCSTQRRQTRASADRPEERYSRSKAFVRR
ncbi:hypothetical protein RvY_00291 [Ramazzottius varieornatus]|uniref:CAP-Gly domain-containing protein n=1 Tax=Ramazzottius varieornatus TaxID=947166 RepID=A0A1D1UGE7_RAMVA|nr:hypothetical protein RvY_00291 [Ramazzottius varieornatus]